MGFARNSTVFETFLLFLQIDYNIQLLNVIDNKGFVVKNFNILLKLIFCSILFTNSVKAAISRTDSMIHVINSLPEDSMRLQKLEEWRIKVIDTPEELICLEVIQEEARRQNNISFQGNAYRGKVRYYFNAIQSDSAIQAAQPALDFFRKHQLHGLLFDTESMIITLYTWDGKYEYSLLKGRQMYDEAVALKSNEGKISACYVLGYACYTSYRFREAVSWYKEGADLLDKEKEFKIESIEFCILTAECYKGLRNDREIKNYADKLDKLLLRYKELHPDKPDNYLSYYYLWLHTTYASQALKQDKLNKAWDELEEASKHITGNTYNLYMDSLYYVYSDYYLAKKEYDKAIDYLNKGIAVQHQFSKEKDPNSLNKRARIFYSMGDYQAAANYTQESLRAADSLNNKRYEEQSQQLYSIYEMNRLEKEEQKQVLTIRIQMLLLTFLCITIFLLSYLLIRFYRIKRELSAATRHAMETDKNTSGFLNNMSREIRQFLKEIADISDALISENEEKKRQEYAATLCQYNEKAQHVIFDILDISKIESDQMKFAFEETSVDGLMNEIYSSLYGLVPETIQMQLVPGTGLTLITDPVRLSQILRNLLRYVLLNSHAGKIIFGYEADDTRICFYITANGLNLTEEKREGMFDRLMQTSGHLLNINLATIISKGLITKMGGTITVTAGQASESRIEFTLPIDHKPLQV